MMVLPAPAPHSFEFVQPMHAGPSGSISAHAELPPPLPLPPFPLAHTRSSPYPMTQSFSALGPPLAGEQPSTRGPSPLGAVPPATPRPLAMSLPVHAGPSAAPTAPQPVVAPAAPVLPPTPEPSPLMGKASFPFPVAMVALAPPADDGPANAAAVKLPPSSRTSDTGDTTPRRLPAMTIDTNVPPGAAILADSASSASASSDKPRSAKLKVSRSDSQPTLSARSTSDARSKSAGRPRARRTQTMHAGPSSHAAGPGPTSVRMMETRSADARTRIRGGAKLARHHTYVPGASSTGGGFASAHSSPGLARAYTESGATPTPTPPRSQLAPEPADLAGPDGGLEAKVVLLGSQGVGKTSLILRYTTRAFAPQPAPATIGNSLYTRKLVHAGTRVKLQIWDTAGQERFRSMAPIYYRGAHVCVLVYDTSDRRSFDDVKSWLDELGRTVPKETVIYVVGAKIDLDAERAVDLLDATRVLRSWLKPPPPVPAAVPTPPQRGILRSTSGRARPESLFVSPTPTRSHSFHALAYVEGSPSTATPASAAAGPLGLRAPPRSPRAMAAEQRTAQSVPDKLERPFPRPILQTSTSTAVPFPSLMITSPTAASMVASRSGKKANRVSFPALQSPAPATAAVTMPSEPVSPTLSSSATLSRHATSAGRFSMSGLSDVLGLGGLPGMTRSASVSGAASNLAQLAQLADLSGQPAPRRRPQSMALPSTTTPRTRTESNPLAPPASAEPAPGAGGRRRSEDWSARWRPDAALDEFAALRKRGSGDRLARKTPPSRTEWAEWPGDVPATAGAAFASFGEAAAQVGEARRGRVRGGSLGRDSRLNGLEPRRDERAAGRADEDWGTDVEGVRIGECSALTGEGVEALFRSISSVLVGRKDKIERDRTLRHKHSVVLTDAPAETAPAKRGGCC